MTSNLSNEITPFIVMEVLERASEMERRGIHVVHLEVGEPDFDIPLKVKDEADRAIRNGFTHYTHSLGDMRLRLAIAHHYEKNYGVKPDAENIVVTSGSSPAILLILAALLNPGDEVIISDPGYACYANFVRTMHGKAIRVPVYAENGFQYSPENIAAHITSRTKAILINSPMNPSGNLLTPETMKAIAGLGPTIVSDEIYHGLVYEGKANSILEFTDNAFVVNGFSKAYAMTGLRLGYCISPSEYIRPIQKLQQNLFICAGSVAQQCGIVALEQCDSELAAMKTVYNERRMYMISRLRQLGFSIPVEPTGAFYILVDARHISNNSYHLAFDILDKAHVGVTPGVDFGPNGEGFLRFSYANSLENIKEGLNRLEKYLAGL
jgi:(5-formylfuran-3-yl)methyl phosphate transaminase